MTPSKPFIASRIERFGDTAMITIERCWFEDDSGPTKRSILEQYETRSRGASASARKAVAKARARESC